MGKEYTIQGVKVSFPYERAYPSQIAMMSKILDALEKGRNALLESPTGSGKSLALLCASLAWQKRERGRVKEFNAAVDNKILEGISEGLFEEEEDAEEEEETLNEGGSNGFMSSSVPTPLHPELLSRRPRKRRVPKIYFGTRTHKQITQIIRELKSTSYKDTPMTLLGSREHACIHPQISKLKSSKTEACRELTDRRNNENSTGCMFLNNVKSKMSSHQSLAAHRKTNEVWDLEDLVSVGKKTRTCPYFVTRELMPQAQIIFCPYNYLIEPMIRKSLEINLKGNILILDEAHNIEDSARSAASFDITQDQVREAMEDLESMAKVELPQTYNALASFCSKVSNWIDGSCSNLDDYSDFNSASKIWTGTEILAAFCLFGLNENEYHDLSSNLNEIIEQRSATINEISEGFKKGPPPPVLNSSTISILEGFFLVLGYLFLEGTKYRDDYRVALTRIQTKNTMKQRRSSIDGWISKGQKKVAQSIGYTYSLHFWCLNPALSFIGVKDDLRSVILTSGTLSPMNSFASELDVSFPITLEASHVIDKKQLFISALSVGPQGHSLNATYINTESYTFQDELGKTILEICNSIQNGILLFLPSYRLLNKLRERWEQTGISDKIQETKRLLQEPRFAHEFENTLRDYTDAANYPEGQQNGAILMAVCRGKVSEGIDFADNMARAVVCVGIPFPNARDPQVDLKKRFNDAKRIQNESILPGNDWYEIQAFRALNQALGRCIRHRYDWGAIIMVDDRYAKKRKYIDGLSKWVRSRVSFFNNFDKLLTQLKDFNIEMRTWEKDLKQQQQIEFLVKKQVVEIDLVKAKSELQIEDKNIIKLEEEASNSNLEESVKSPLKEKKVSLTEVNKEDLLNNSIHSPIQEFVFSPVKVSEFPTPSKCLEEDAPVSKKRKIEQKSKANPIQYFDDSDEDFI
ncbi:Fanconi anemia group J protein homolog [Lepeophtheirus salmonis]|uniref:Fanconi anemia group J protein homolog n=1 Tax=Lepeophtheirus salmonis TaxID=72036 RepID=UPI001AE1696C|nr:Fanconi anemia group J protein-like [Lepeophtheirus salmonis]